MFGINHAWLQEADPAKYNSLTLSWSLNHLLWIFITSRWLVKCSMMDTTLKLKNATLVELESKNNKVIE